MTTLDLVSVATLLRDGIISLPDVGYTVHDVTWRDVGQPWPHPLVLDPAQATDADSVGVEIESADRGGKLVFFRGGWADLAVVSRDDAPGDVFESPGVRDEIEAAAVIQRFVRLLS